MELAETNVDAAQATTGSDALYERISAEFGPPLARVARAHEADPSLQQDLLQEIHCAIWRSLPAFGGRCSLRTWVYRVAHNVAATHVLRARRRRSSLLVNLDDVEVADGSADAGVVIDEARALERLTQLIQRLKPVDREVIVLHMEALSRDEIAEITGLATANVAIKLHRIKLLLARSFGRKETP
jgi:RNA polymerase sigma-70 factor (ECF subfamily)